jgi:hypothetical protein
VHKENPVKVKALNVGSYGPGGPAGRLTQELIDATGRSDWNARAVAAYLKHNRGRIIGGRRFASKESGGRAQWRLEWVKKPDPIEQMSLVGI